MSNELATMPEKELNNVLRNSLFPNASDMSLELVKGYCKAANLDIMQKPCHIIPMWNSSVGRMVDTIMPGIGLYRITAARTGQYAGISEPEYGPTITRELGGVMCTYPEYCKITVKRNYGNFVAEFTAKELWIENYAEKGGNQKSITPNSMWMKRPFGQIAKVAEAQALRKAFPEVGSQQTADEMEGKTIHEERVINPMPNDKPPVDIAAILKSITVMSIEDFKTIDKDSLTVEQQRMVSEAFRARKAAIKEASVVAAVEAQQEVDPTDWGGLIADAESMVALMAIMEAMTKEQQEEYSEAFDLRSSELKAAE